jgi:hypothetical protein
MNQLKQQSTVNNQNTKDDLKILLRILSIKTLLQFRPLLYIFMIRQLISGQPLSQYEYALQQSVVLFGELLILLEEAGLTHTYRDVLRFCELKNIDCLVLRYLNTGQPPFEEWAEEWLLDGKV